MQLPFDSFCLLHSVGACNPDPFFPYHLSYLLDLSQAGSAFHAIIHSHFARCQDLAQQNARIQPSKRRLFLFSHTPVEEI